jgi:hypothetical protein
VSLDGHWRYPLVVEVYPSPPIGALTSLNILEKRESHLAIEWYRSKTSLSSRSLESGIFPVGSGQHVPDPALSHLIDGAARYEVLRIHSHVVFCPLLYCFSPVRYWRHHLTSSDHA